MGQRSIPAPFLMKTYELVDNPITNDVISWGDNGSTFIVWKTADFAKDLLPKYFKHTNFSSFVRQLNTYGFRKIVPDKWEFSNENFKKDEKFLLINIRRRKITKAPRKTTVGGGSNVSRSPSGNDVGSTSTSSPGIVEIEDLSGDNEKLRRDNEMLSLELRRAKKQFDELMTYMTSNLNVGPDDVNLILCGGGLIRERVQVLDVNDDDNYKEDNNDGLKEGLKLFGVWLKQVDGVECCRKRRKCDDFRIGNNTSVNNNDNDDNLGTNSLNYCRKYTRTR